MILPGQGRLLKSFQSVCGGFESLQGGAEGELPDKGSMIWSASQQLHRYISAEAEGNEWENQDWNGGAGSGRRRTVRNRSCREKIGRRLRGNRLKRGRIESERRGRADSCEGLAGSDERK